MVTSVDAAIGEVLAALAQRGMLDRTIVVFHANTGGAVKRKYPIGDGDTTVNVANNGPYRGGRGGLHEGGVRAVALVWRPGEVPAGTITELIHAVDLYPTLLNRAGALTEQTKPVDGLDMWPTIVQGEPSPRNEPSSADSSRGQSATIAQAKPSPRKEALINVEEFRGALRMGDWKLIQQATLPPKIELYNLRADPSEEDNQAEREPERVQTMLRRLTEYAWQMAPASYLEALAQPRKVEVPIYWGENPTRP
jgi:arylsulfatase B